MPPGRKRLMTARAEKKTKKDPLKKDLSKGQIIQRAMNPPQCMRSRWLLY